MTQQKKALGESLLEAGIITTEQLKSAHEEQKHTGQRLRKVLVKKGFISEEDLVEFLSMTLGLPLIDLDNYLIDPKVIDLVPEELARKYELIPILKIGNRVTCAMVDPWNIFALDEVRARTQLIVEPAVAIESDVRKALDQYYGARGSLEDVVKTISSKQIHQEGEEIDLKKLEKLSEEPIVIKLVNLFIMQAVKEGASDIHIEPEEERLRVRFRVDGVLHDVSAPPKYLQSAIASRIKLLAGLDIAEKRSPQDGRFDIKMEGREIDLRVSCVPTLFGENVVLRLLDISNALISLKELGFSETTFKGYQELLSRPHGIILVTGPTGSGKTTTLYSSLDKINSVEKNIITIEDPVEYKLPGVRQIAVNSKVNLTFANGLRSILRQDPDVIMVGEIRDFETAEIAIRSALTGHLVFSTLHTNDAPSTIMRLIDMGVEPFLISSSLIGILAQRLIRVICKACKQEYTPTPEALKGIGLSCKKQGASIKFYKGKGCELCMDTGYKGRCGIFEFLPVDEGIRSLILTKVPLQDLKKQAVLSGMTTLYEDGIEKIKAGITTVEEVFRVTCEE